jgi:hypothetical protein
VIVSESNELSGGVREGRGSPPTFPPPPSRFVPGRFGDTTIKIQSVPFCHATHPLTRTHHHL